MAGVAYLLQTPRSALSNILHDSITGEKWPWTRMPTLQPVISQPENLTEELWT